MESINVQNKKTEEDNCFIEEQKLNNNENVKNLINETNEDACMTDITSAEEYLEKKNVILLPYEKQIFLDMIQSDALMICARGISYDRPLIHILRAYSDFANLILVINSSDWEEEYYKSQLEKKYIREVSNSVNEREITYLEGGIQFVSTRILVVDLLKNRVPIDLITGIVVLRAHTIVESCQEAFALRLYRQKNKTGFIKAFSQSPESFTIGWSHVERTMRNLFVKELFLWPRFHATIQHSIKPYESQAIEFHVPMTINMTKIQAHILDIMNYLIKEVKRINRYVDLEEVTAENCVTKKFHKILQAQLDPIWHRLNSQTKLIISDLKVLRNLIISTIYGDAVSSFNLTRKYRTTEYAMNNSGWTLLDAAENLFSISKNRVYNSQGEFEPEHCPKWKALSEILRVEIPNDIKTNNKSNSEPVKVLILCQDAKTCYQLNQFLMEGPERCLFTTAIRADVPIIKLSDVYKEFSHNKIKREVDSTFKQKSKGKCAQQSDINLDKKQEENVEKFEEDDLDHILNKGDAQPESDLFQESYILTMTQNIDVEKESISDTDDDIKHEQSVFEPFPEMENLDLTTAISASSKKMQPMICIQTFKTQKDGAKGLDRTLNEFQPQYVVMYHCNVTAVRQLEVHEATLRRKPKERMRIFFLFHSKTIEEQSYLTSLRREKQAFELLIDTKKTMLIPEYQDGKTDEAFEILKPIDHDELDVWGMKQSSRKAGGQESQEKKEELVHPKIIVDMREFRSDLPCLIHRRGLQVIPLTITIGDYILTPEICVERKSISDLIGSLNSGRLYNQCIQMQRFYAKPILLIEFDQNKPFHLQNKFMLSGVSTVSSNADVVQRLQLLTLHFPKLRLIWSPSPYATAQLFEELKHGKEEPDSMAAVALGNDDSSQFEVDIFNSNIYDFMTRLPGVNSKNIHKIMRNGGSLKELLKKTVEELSELCNSETDGKLLWDSLHVSHLPDKDKEPMTSSIPNANPSTSGYVSGKIFKKLGRGRVASCSGRGNNRGFNRGAKKF
ncbi:DNA repair endonuclease XPF [Condylostylus longicornis]|uniref:DNA repair endonuclease XPF n=1 Tax=Condylostylus longicornis TaxID=2530218 RepID=UPI00244E102E|nr:DNA repair endonuclease XPF [Condylostylus longicornis]